MGGVVLIRRRGRRSIGQGIFRSEGRRRLCVGRDDRQTKLTQRNRIERKRGELAGLYPVVGTPCVPGGQRLSMRTAPRQQPAASKPQTHTHQVIDRQGSAASHIPVNRIASPARTALVSDLGAMRSAGSGVLADGSASEPVKPLDRLLFPGGRSTSTRSD